MKLEEIHERCRAAIDKEIAENESGDFRISVEAGSLEIYITGWFSKDEYCVFGGDWYNPAEYEETCHVVVDSIEATSEWGDVSLPIDAVRLEKECSYSLMPV